MVRQRSLVTPVRAVVALALGLLLSGRSGAEEPPLALRPYGIRAWLAVDPAARLDARGRADLIAAWRGLVGRFVGAPWVLEVADGDGPLGQASLDELDPATIGPLAAGVDKVWAIRVEAAGSGFAFRGREFDVLTGRLGPPRRRPAPFPTDAPRALLGLALDLFCPTAEIGPESGGGVSLTVRGAGLPAASPAGRVAGVGSAFVPIRLFLKPDGSTLDAREVRRSYLQVQSLDGASARCAIISGLRDPLSRRVARRNTLVALGVKPGDRPTRLRYVEGDDRTPAAGYTVTVRPAPDGPAREVGTTGRDGRIVLEPGVAEGLVIVRLLAAGVEPLDEFPTLPGEAEEERTILVDPKPEAVALEVRLDALRDELIDLVATRARLEARLKARAEGSQWDEVDALLKEFRALPPRDTLNDRLARLKDDAARRQAEIKRPILTRTAQALLADTQGLIDRYLDDGAFLAYEEALRESQDGGGKSPASPVAGAPTSPASVSQAGTPTAPVTGSGPPGWSVYQDPELGFQVLAPGEPKRAELRIEQEGILWHDYLLIWPPAPKLQILAVVKIAPPGVDFEAIQEKIWEQVLARAVKNSPKFQLLADRKITYRGLPGREFIYNNTAAREKSEEPGILRVRGFTRTDKFYTFVYGYDSGGEAGAEAFFNSISLDD